MAEKASDALLVGGQGGQIQPVGRLAVEHGHGRVALDAKGPEFAPGLSLSASVHREKDRVVRRIGVHARRPVQVVARVAHLARLRIAEALGRRRRLDSRGGARAAAQRLAEPGRHARDENDLDPAAPHLAFLLRRSASPRTASPAPKAAAPSPLLPTTSHEHDEDDELAGPLDASLASVASPTEPGPPSPDDDPASVSHVYSKQNIS